MKERPEYSHPLCSALQGPTANDSELMWPSFVRNENELKLTTTKHGKNLLDEWKSPTSLYLYHDKRYCVSRENDDKSDVCLFSSDNASQFQNDASNKMYEHQFKDYKLYETMTGSLRLLREKLQTTGKGQYPIKTLRCNKK